MNEKPQKIKRNLLIPFPEDIDLIANTIINFAMSKTNESFLKLLQVIYPDVDITLSQKILLNLAILRHEPTKIVSFKIKEVPEDYPDLIKDGEEFLGTYYDQLGCVVFELNSKWRFIPVNYCEIIKNL